MSSRNGWFCLVVTFRKRHRFYWAARNASTMSTFDGKWHYPIIDAFLRWHFASRADFDWAKRSTSDDAHIWWAITFLKSTRIGWLFLAFILHKPSRLTFGCAKYKWWCPRLMGNDIIEVNPQLGKLFLVVPFRKQLRLDLVLRNACNHAHIWWAIAV